MDLSVGDYITGLAAVVYDEREGWSEPDEWEAGSKLINYCDKFRISQLKIGGSVTEEYYLIEIHYDCVLVWKDVKKVDPPKEEKVTVTTEPFVIWT